MIEIKENGFNPESIVQNGNKFLTGNGYIGYRGMLDEFGKAECVGLNIAGVYDGVQGKWRETVNAFNPLYMHVFAGDTSLDVRGENTVSHETSLDISRGIFSRKTTYSVRGATVTLRTERFVNMANKNNICSRTVVTSDKDMLFVFRVGVDTDIWELNGPHFKDVKTKLTKNVIEATGVTQELGRKVRVACEYSGEVTQFDNGFGLITAFVKAGESFMLDRLAYVSVDDEKVIRYESYDQALVEHAGAWKKLWRDCRMIIDGDERGQLALDYSIYHLLIIAPKGDYSIAARGLSGQTYKGAVFWDTEIFMLPFYLSALPDVAERLIKYRINTLPAAKEKAKYYGYGGAFYAWESQDGYDACSDFNVTDVFTHRPIRTYFKDKQIHISADVAYAILEYYNRTADDKLMLNGGLETVLECAEFARTYSYYNHIKDRYELLDVIGPDEYHERVNNNAYTNYMFYQITKRGVELAEKFKNVYSASAVKKLKEWVEKLYLPQPNADGVIEQFDGYFGLEDVSVETVRGRLAHPREYWGGSGGVATATRVIKQADVIMLFNLYPDLFPTDIQRKNYEFYLPYTEHGSSLSHCAYALTACRIGKPDDAYSAFLDSAEIDLRGGGKQWAGDVYIGGTHPAASGGAWMAAKAIFGKKGEWT
ncbi:MAG: glycoside hydrolase family 65 protein [Clostridiales bacterium]|nr:glycoside hydrolase family 65 protein [Clostridiales bacterium]